ncbi:hypothetical protein FACS1894141_0440 [Spirochaetia bacterium]|nr:hypothetical protein FACS1894141_0440 [Spirochaetia bacterium]
MQCTNNIQLHEALAALVAGSTGTTRDALAAIMAYTDDRLSPAVEDFEKSAKECIKAARRQMYSDRCCNHCQNFMDCAEIDKSEAEGKAIAAAGGDHHRDARRATVDTTQGRI